jgi:hypothetical protein
VVVLTAGVVGFRIYAFVQGFTHGTATCLPTDFPRYPGAIYASQIYELNGAYPGNTCNVVLDSNDDVATVTAFYQSTLNAGAWQVTSTGEQADKVTFQRANSDAPFGTVQVAVGNTRTEITIDLFDSTCLPLNFPKYPGAKFGGQNEGVGAANTRSGCHVVYVSNDRVSTVTAFYGSALNTGRWQVTSRTAGQVGWRLTNGKRTDASGKVTVVVSGERTEITVDAFP